MNRRFRRLGGVVVGVVLTACSSSSDPGAIAPSGSTSSADTTIVTGTTDPLPTSTVPSTTEAPPSTSTMPAAPIESAESEPVEPTRPGFLLGGSAPTDEILYFVSDDATWRLRNVTVGPTWIERPTMLLVGEGDFVTRARAAVRVGPDGALAETGGSNSATTGGLAEPVTVGDVETIGRVSTASGLPLVELEWPAPDDYRASLVAVGLDLDEAAQLAEHIAFDGTEPVLAASSGFRVVERPQNPISVSAMFDDGVVGFMLDCENTGDGGAANYQMAALARTVPRTVEGVLVAQRADPEIGPSQSSLDGSAWLVGDWWCKVFSAPPGGSGEVPAIDDDRFEAFLASLRIVDEAELRASDPDTAVTVTASPDAPSSTDSESFSAGAAGASTWWHAWFAPGDDRIVVFGYSGGDGVMQFHDSVTGEMLLSLPIAMGGCADRSITSDGAAVWDGASIRSTVTGEVIVQPELSHRASSGVFSPDGTLLAVAGGRDRVTTLIDVVSGEQILDMPAEDYIALCPTFFSDSRRVLLPGLFPYARVRDVVADKELLAIEGYGEPSISPDDRYLAVPTEQSARLVDADSGADIAELGVFVTFSPDGATLARFESTGSSSLLLWDIASRSDQVQVPWGCGVGEYRWCASFAPDGRNIAVVTGGVAEVRDVASGDLLITLAPEGATVRTVDYSADGSQIVTSNSDGTIRVWDAP